ncbi:Tethering factor for nuclear proteasome sts1 [Claviceps maximensis]|nr:Tethering factor for nuclear proteasome sts1 [Claviceps maximensis]
MNVLLSPQPPVFPHYHDISCRSPRRSVSPLSSMTNRKRKADDDGDETMSPLSSPAFSTRALARPSKKARSIEVVGRPLSLPRLLETLDAKDLRTVLERISERHSAIGQEVVAAAPRPSVLSALNVLRDYQKKLNEAAPYGESSAEYTYYRVKESLMALIDALSDFTPQYLPPNESQPTKSLEFLDGATNIVHDLPDWDPQAYRHHKENAYDEISKAWALVISEAGKRGGGINLHSGGWHQTLARHHERSGGRLASAMSAMANNVGWMGPGPDPSVSGNTSSEHTILSQLMSGAYGSPVRVGPW